MNNVIARFPQNVIDRAVEWVNEHKPDAFYREYEDAVLEACNDISDADAAADAAEAAL